MKGSSSGLHSPFISSVYSDPYDRGETPALWVQEERMRTRTVFLAIGVVGFISALGVGSRVEEYARSPHIPRNLGNWPEIVRPLEAYPEDRSLSFAVVGDTHGTGTFKTILEELRRREVDFIVNLGDFVSQPTRENHAFFIKQMERSLDPAGPPLLMVMGNHDVDPGTFPVAAFESVYGPATFAFECAGNLFVMVANAVPGKREERKKWQRDLERLISARRHSVRRVFVLMHIPPTDPIQPMGDHDTARFRERWGGLGVDYVISGHIHGYGRSQIGGTVALVSAGGGGRLLPHRSGEFHHAVILRVGGDRVMEEILPVAPHTDLADKAERVLLTQVLPIWSRALAAMGLEKGTALAWGRSL
jgi:predicted phosphodiesterase